MESAGIRTVGVLDCTRLPLAVQEAAIRKLAADSAVLEVRGWRAAERNLDFVAVWLARLLGHGADAAYLAQGGIEGVAARALHMPFSSWRITARTIGLCGAQTTLRAEKFDDAEKKLDSHGLFN